MTLAQLLELPVGSYVKWTGQIDKGMLGRIVQDGGPKAIKWADGTRVELDRSIEPDWFLRVTLSKKKAVK